MKPKSFASFAVKVFFLRVLRGENFFTVNPEEPKRERRFLSVSQKISGSRSESDREVAQCLDNNRWIVKQDEFKNNYRAKHAKLAKASPTPPVF